MSSDDRLVCNACQFTVRTSEERASHYRGEWHRYNVKRRCAGLAPMAASAFAAQLSAMASERERAQAQAAGLLPRVRSKCAVCGRAFSSKASFDAHLLSRKHLKLERGQLELMQQREQSDGAEEVEDEDDGQHDVRGDSDAAAVERNDFDECQDHEHDDEEEQEGEEEEKKDASPQDRHFNPQLSSPSSSSASSSFSSGDPLVTATATLSLSPSPSSASTSPSSTAALSLPSSHGPAPASTLVSPADYNGYALRPGEAPVAFLSCLFCPQLLPSLPDCLSHMHRLHGFFVPFAAQLSSAEALLVYLGEKVGIGHCCVYCSQRFSSTQAARQHMREKSHAKMRLDTEDDEDEYSDFFDFDTAAAADSAGLPGAEGGEKAARRTPASISDAGELLLSDGSTIGHRQYAQVYNQHVRVHVERESVQAYHDGIGVLVRTADGPRGQQQLVAASAAARGLRGNEKDSGKRYRESWVQKNERRLALKTGMRANTQMHYRPQVQF